MRQEDGKQADPLTLYAVPDQQRRSLSHSQPQLHRLGGCGMPGTQPWGMPPLREAGHLRQDGRGRVGKSSSSDTLALGNLERKTSCTRGEVLAEQEPSGLPLGR